MKTKLAALLLAAVVSGSLFAQTAPVIRNKDGEVLQHPQVIGFDGQFFSVQHDGGIAKVAFASMPEQLRGSAASASPSAIPAATPSPQLAAEVARRDAARKEQLLAEINLRRPAQLTGNKAFDYHGRFYVLKARARAQAKNIAEWKIQKDTWGFDLGEGSDFVRVFGMRNAEGMAQLHQQVIDKWEGVDGYFLVCGVAAHIDHALPLGQVFAWCSPEEFERGGRAEEWARRFQREFNASRR